MTVAADRTSAASSLVRRAAFSRELWLALVVVVTRLPLISAGYGRDGDAWLTMQAASRIAATGHYAASRLPGYPLVEYAYAALPSRSPVWANGLTVLVTAAAAVLFYRLALRLRCGSPFLLALAFVMTPVVYVASATTMDYLWALALVLASLLLAMRQREDGSRATGSLLASGALLGFATGARIGSAVFALELAPLLATTPAGRRVRTAGAWVAGFLAAAALVWWPVLRTYGTGFLTFYEDQSPTLAQRAAHGTFQVWGLLGLLGLAAAFVIEARHGFAGVREHVRVAGRVERWWLGLLVALVVAELAVFARLPHEAAYLIPVVPLALLLAGRVAGRTAVTVLCVCLIASPFVLNLDDYDFTQEGQDVRVGLAGPIFFDRDQRVVLRAAGRGDGGRGGRAAARRRAAGRELVALRRRPRRRTWRGRGRGAHPRRPHTRRGTPAPGGRRRRVLRAVGGPGPARPLGPRPRRTRAPSGSGRVRAVTREGPWRCRHGPSSFPLSATPGRALRAQPRGVCSAAVRRPPSRRSP